MKISVITVTLNNAEYLEDCIKSVLGQDYENIEYIIVDGGSIDGTFDIIKKYEDKIDIWISEPDKGIYDAMNKGIRMATGDVVGILNADDVFYGTDVLTSIAAVMSDFDIDACYSDLIYVDRKNINKVVRYWRSSPFVSGLFKEAWVPPHPTFYVRRRVYDQYGVFDLKYKLAADFDLMLRFLENYRIKAVYVPKVFVKMRIGGVTNKSIWNILQQNYEILRSCKINNIKIFPPTFLMNKFIVRFNQFHFESAV